MGDGRFGTIDQMYQSACYFTQIVWRYIRRQADGDAGRAIEYQVRQACWQDDGLIHRAVEVRRPVDRALPKLGQ